MKVYVVTSGEYSNYGVDAVFLDEATEKERAKKIAGERHAQWMAEREGIA